MTNELKTLETKLLNWADKIMEDDDFEASKERDVYEHMYYRWEDMGGSDEYVSRIVGDALVEANAMFWALS